MTNGAQFRGEEEVELDELVREDTNVTVPLQKKKKSAEHFFLWCESEKLFYLIISAENLFSGWTSKGADKVREVPWRGHKSCYLEARKFLRAEVSRVIHVF